MHPDLSRTLVSIEIICIKACDPFYIDVRSINFVARRRRARLAPLRRRTERLRSRVRRPRKNDLKKYGIKAAKGVGLGLAVSIPLTLAARHLNMPILMEVGQRIGSVASTAVGGTVGNAAYQGADAIFDRFVTLPGGGGVSGTSQVYL